MDPSSSSHVSGFRVDRFAQRVTGKLTRSLLDQSFTSRKWTAELVLVLALFEQVLQQFFRPSSHGSFLNTMVSLNRLSQVSSHVPRELLSTVSCGVNRKRRRFRKTERKV